MINETTRSINGTSFHGTTINTKVQKLIDLFPNSYYEENTGVEKSNFDFTLETSEGVIFTIYDWKEYRPIGLNEVIEFHIGGLTKMDTENAKRELLKLI